MGKKAIIRKEKMITLCKDVKKFEPLYNVSGDVNRCGHCGKQCGGSSGKKMTDIIQSIDLTSG